MRGKGILFFLIVSSLDIATTFAQSRASVSPPPQQGVRSAAEVDALLQEAAQLVQRTRQSSPEERINQYRELERLFAKLQEAQQQNPGIAGGAGTGDQAIILRQAAQVLEQAIRNGTSGTPRSFR